LTEHPGRAAADPGVRLVVLGRAVTQGQALPLGVDDPVVAARAVRRALAHAGRRAVEVTDLVLATTETVPSEALAMFVRRALGPHGSSIAMVSLASDAPDAAGLAARAADLSRGDVAPGSIRIAVGVDDRGAVVALCVGSAPGYLTTA
jgi:hypothetical protein